MAHTGSPPLTREPNTHPSGQSVLTTQAPNPTAIPWPFGGTPQWPGWRTAAAVGAVTEAAGHIPVTADHLTEAPYIGVGFVLLTAAGLLLAPLLLLAGTTAVWAWTAIVAGAALLGYVLSRTIGLPMIQDDIGDWAEPLGIVCVIAETLMLIAASASLLQRKSKSTQDPVL